MNAIDTNVLIYRLDRNDPVKRAKAKLLCARLLTSSPPTVLLWQVAGELLQYLRRWAAQQRVSPSQTKRHFRATRRMFFLELPTPALFDRSIELTDRYSLSHWDSMIVAACIEAGVTTLYTEDMGAPRTIDSLKLENPFA